MPRDRIIVPHCNNDAPMIDAFRCSRCEWTYPLPEPKPYLIACQDAENACRKFDEHRCEDFSRGVPRTRPGVQSGTTE